MRTRRGGWSPLLESDHENFIVADLRIGKVTEKGLLEC